MLKNLQTPLELDVDHHRNMQTYCLSGIKFHPDLQTQLKLDRDTVWLVQNMLSK